MRVKIIGIPQANNGISVENNNYQQLSPFTKLLGGDNHENGGTKIAFQGKTVEAEKGEPVAIDQQGNAVVYGNMKIPGTNNKFKNVVKDIGIEEGKATKQMTKGAALLENSPFNKFSALSFNSGKVLQEAANMKLKNASAKKEALSSLQNQMLDYAETTGIAPEKIDTIFKNGGSIARNGKSLAEENNNPGNLRFVGQKGATKGKGGFAKFENYNAGLVAMQKDLKAKQTGHSSTGLNGNNTLLELISKYAPEKDGNNPVAYANTVARQLGITPNTSIGGLNTTALADAMSMVEDSKYRKKMMGPNPAFDSSLEGAPGNNRMNGDIPMTREPNDDFDPLPLLPNIPITNTEVNGPNTTVPLTPAYNVPPIKARKLPSLADRNTLGIKDFMSEIPALFDRADFVPKQSFNPQLFQSYQISNQDVRNQNTSTFNALRQQIGNNPEALSSLAGQKYSADSQSLAEQFRTNQGITNQVINQNNQLLNQAQLTNLQLQDTQQQRMTMAQANTENRRDTALASISNKFALNRRDNNSIRMEENLFPHFRPDENMNMQYDGTKYAFSGQPTAYDNTKKIYRDAAGNVIKTIETDDPDYIEAEKRRKAAKMSTRQWGGMFSKKMNK